MRDAVTAKAPTLSTEDRIDRLEAQISEMKITVYKLRMSNGQLRRHFTALRAVWIEGLSALTVEDGAMADTEN